MPSIPSPSALTITNPLVQYRTLLRLQRIDNDPAQHRLALKLQDLYHQLKDYNPHIEYSDRINQISHAVGSSADRNNGGNVFSSGGFTRPSFSSLFRRSPDGSSTALIRSINSRESALKIQSPRGLLIHGEVGRGKTLLLNLLADCLPTAKKRRLHFNVFMLEIFRKLEDNRKERLATSLHSPDVAYEHSILSLAREFIFTSPIIFLDEFQLPDRVASKLLSSLLTSFFHLGGVLIATSNRLPEELAKASGVEFAVPERSRSLGTVTSARNFAPGAADFADFLEVLKARCGVWEMEGEMDWRRQESSSRSPSPNLSPEEHPGTVHDSFFAELGSLSSPDQHHDQSTELSKDLEKESVIATLPSRYQLLPPESSTASKKEWEHQVKISTSFNQQAKLSDIPWESGSLHVYGRTLYVPKQFSNITMWSFPDLCGKNVGPADYITLASTFDTFILVDVPILTYLMKNEARRYITLLDALYESGCRLLIRAAAPPDDLFFPETKTDSLGEPGGGAEGDDPVYQETYSEVYQDSTSPFRPNVSSYLDEGEALPRIAQEMAKGSPLRSVLADEDADFGPVYGDGRRVGAGPARDERHQTPSVDGFGGPDFTQAHSTLVGEDERFAYKRARSRLWEMCGDRWWNREDFWKPVDVKIRHWERARDEGNMSMSSRAGGSAHEMFKHGASPFRTVQQPPPQFNFTHFWRMMTWGKKAGPWGRGELRGDLTTDSTKKDC